MSSSTGKPVVVDSPLVGQIKSFISGGFGGIACVLVGMPFDTIKVRLQTSTQYKGALDCFKQTVAKEGIRGLYKGMLSPLIGITPVFAISFWVGLFFSSLLFFSYFLSFPYYYYYY